MVDPTTVNTSLSVPIRGTDVGTWDVPVNGNFTSIDAIFGSVTTVALTSAPVTLTTSQALVNVIRLTGTLNFNVEITLPGIYKSWTIDNQLTNSPSSYAATFLSTGGTSIIGAPPGPQDIFYDGTTIKYKGLGKIGEYWDYCGSVMPNWIGACSIPPYLNCDGTVFSSATYPILANLLGTTLPDARGRSRFALNQTTGRLTSSQGGLDGNTVGAGAGAQTITLLTAHLPPYTPAGTVNSTGTVGIAAPTNYNNTFVGGAQAIAIVGGGTTNLTIGSSFTGTAQGGLSTPTVNVPPAYVGGLTLIRAA